MHVLFTRWLSCLIGVLHISCPLPVEAVDRQPNCAFQQDTARDWTALEHIEVAPTIAEGRLSSTEALESTGLIFSERDVSPNGRRYVIRLVRANLKANQLEVGFLAGVIDAHVGARAPTLVSTFCSTGLGSSDFQFGSEFDVLPFNQIRWAGGDKIAFLWSDEGGRRQVWSIDLLKKTTTQLTTEPVGVTQFDVAPNGALLFNSLTGPNSGSEALVRGGFAIGDQIDFYAILQGRFSNQDRWIGMNRAQWRVRRAGEDPRNIDLNGEAFDLSNPFFKRIAVAPNGAWAFLDASLDQPAPSWRKYKGHMVEAVLNARLDDAAGRYTSKHPIVPLLLNLHDGVSKRLWDAPLGDETQVSWSPDGRFLLIGPTYLPPESNSPKAGSSTNFAVVEVSSASYRVLPMELSDRRFHEFHWRSDNLIQIESDQVGSKTQSTTDSFKLLNGAWKMIASHSRESGAEKRNIYISEGLNSPPALVTRRADGHEIVLLDPTPQLRNHSKLGNVTEISGRFGEDREWGGLLITPPQFDPRRPVPLVIQSYYGAEIVNNFNLYGVLGDGKLLAVGPNMVPSYPGQLLAARGIAVLTLGPIGRSSDRNEARDRTDAILAAIDQLVSAGIADPAKIGLAGFSRNGYFVEYALTHSDYPFAAAMVADNYSPNYMQSAMRDWEGGDAEVIGAPPFGPGLQDWLREAPAFRAEEISTPLQMIAQSHGIVAVAGAWEMFSRLRRLHRPVELYVMPNAIEHGGHSTQNPQQILGIQERVLDWFDFWLNDRIDHSPGKVEQYGIWEALRKRSGPTSSSVVDEPR